MKNNKQLLVGAIFLGLLVAGFFAWLFWDPFHKVSGPKVVAIPSPVQSEMKLAANEYPQLGLSFRGDEYHLRLTLAEIPSAIDKVEYDFTYLAHDNQGREFEKGQYDSFDISSPKVTSDILLGTSSCTTGTCRYRYDKNVSEGKVSLTLINKKRQSLQLESPFWFVRPGKTVKISGHQARNKGTSICLVYKGLQANGKSVLHVSCLPGGILSAKDFQ